MSTIQYTMYLQFIYVYLSIIRMHITPIIKTNIFCFVQVAHKHLYTYHIVSIDLYTRISSIQETKYLQINIYRSFDSV